MGFLFKLHNGQIYNSDERVCIVIVAVVVVREYVRFVSILYVLLMKRHIFVKQVLVVRN